MKKRKNNNPKNSDIQYLARFSGLAFEMLGIIFLGTWGGNKIDKHLAHEFPLWTIILSLVSIFISLYLVFTELKKNGPKSS